MQNLGSAASHLPLMRQKVQGRSSQVPYKSQAQRGYFHANKNKLQRQGVNVDEWNQASKGLDLPERAPQQKKKHWADRAAASKRK